ncbi:hypothetical protein [Paenibacillus oleatilyticus]|uniref:hypothetical protein n=1 Tax=Paenibacillus oleatilyticus TaxID=2594886 RepID=UPI001C1FD9F4|nr:hypothetical protein [Paenibacillus oleatilyticus]MBU7315973.1 hypothetical protein [Paenibacillus oleatilyticus]
MDERMKEYISDTLRHREKEALKTVVSAIYFMDSSDYLTALWEAANELLDEKIPENAGNDFICDLYDYLSDEL